MARITFAISHSEHAGAQQVLFDLALEFQRRGHHATLLALYPGRTTFPPHPTLGWSHCIEQAPRSPADVAGIFRATMRQLDRFRPDVVLTALPAANVILPLAALANKRRPRMFVSHHSPVATYNGLYRRLGATVSSTRIVSGVVCVSQAVRSTLGQNSRAVLAKTHILRNALPPGVEALTAYMRIVRRQTYQSGRALIASGRLAEQKNYPVLIKAMAYLRDTRLDIVGTGPDEASLKALAQQCGVAERVCFLGLKSREETLRLIATKDAFVQPSLFEGHSLALLEAAAIGVPLIVSNVSSQIEGITRSDGVRCGLVVDAFDAAGLANSIDGLLENKEERQRLQHLSCSLGDETNFVSMVDAYEELLCSRSSERSF